MKYLSKLLSMLLVGVLLFAGCTDYDEDIKNLNNKIDKVQQELVEGHIAPLRADLETTKTSLETAKKQLNDALGALQTKHDQDIAALKTNLEKQIADAVSNANAAITALEGKLTAEVTAREAAIKALTGELNKAKADLEAAYKAADTALQAELLGKIGELETALKGEVSALETKLNGDIATLRTDMEKAVKAANDAIKDANDKIADLKTDLDAEVAARKADIETAKASLEAAKAALQKAIDDEATARANGDAQLATNLANEVAARKAAVTALEEKLQAAIDAEAAAREEADKKLQAQIDATNKALADAKAALEAADAELQKAIDAEAAARKAADENLSNALDAEAAARKDGDEKLAKDLADEVEARKAAVAALEAAIAKLEAKLDAELNLLKARDAQFEAQIAALQAGLEAANDKVDGYYNELKGDVAALQAALQAQINQNKADIANNKVNINKLTSDLAALNGQVNGLQQTVGFLANELYKHLAAFNEYQAVVNGRLAAVEALAEQNAVAIEAIEATIADLESQIATNAALINQNVADIAANAAALDEFKKAATNTFEVLANADLALQNAINNLSIYVDSEIAAVRGDLAAAKAAIEAELAASFSALTEQVKNIEAAHAADNAAVKAELEAIQSTVNALSKYLGDEVAAREAADQKISEALNALNLAYDLKMREIDAKIAALDTRLTSLEEELKAYREEVKKMIDNAIVAAVSKAQDYTDQKVNNLQAYLSEKVKELNENMSNAIEAAKEEAAAALAAAVKAIDLKIENLQDQIDEIAEHLASMIQNITFVPEYNDGLATAVRILGPEHAGSLTATTLTAQFDIVPAEAVNGLVNYPSENNSVRVYAKVQPVKTTTRVEPIYVEGTQLIIAPVAGVEGRVSVTAFVKDMPTEYGEYAFTLGVETQKTQAMSDYVYIHQNDTPQYQYTFVNDKNQTIEAHPNYDAGEEALVFSNKWTKAAESGINAVEGFQFKLTDGKNFFTTDEITTLYNMTPGSLDLTFETETAKPCVAFVDGTTIKMSADNEYDMYKYIGHAGEATILAHSALAGWEYRIDLIYNITGVRVENNTYYITEPGDLYWVSVDSRIENVNAPCKVVFDVLDELNNTLDMEGYVTKKPKGPYKPISNYNYDTANELTVLGKEATITNLVAEGDVEAGVFGKVLGSIKKLNVTNSTFVGKERVGSIVGHILGNVENCNADKVNVTAVPYWTGSEWDGGNSVGALVGYLEGDSNVGPFYNVKNNSVTNSKVYAFRDAAAVVGTAFVGTDNVANNTTDNVQVLAIQRPALYPGYIRPANVGYIIGRVLPTAPYAWEENNNVFNFANSSLRIQYAVGAEVDATPVDASKHTLEIFTANGLAWFSNNVVNKDYYTYTKVVFTDNIDFGGKTYFEADKCTFKAINNWEGKLYRSFEFDGQNKVVSNLTINDPTAKDLGLFGSYVGDVKNVTMKNVTLIGLGRIAPLASRIWGNIDNCHVDGFVGYAIAKNNDDGDKVGGLVAQMQDPNAITNCSVKNADIEGYRDLGAVAGMANLNKYENVDVENVNIWVNQLNNTYGSYVPFATESALVGRQTGAVKPAIEAEGVGVYNILTNEFGRRYVTDRHGDLYLGYDVTASTVEKLLLADDAAAGRALKFDAKQNAEALVKFAAEYKSYKEKTVNQVTDMNLEGKTWNAIGATDDGFWGIYNGNNKAISNLNVVGYETTPSGLFGEVVGDIKNVKITGANISGCHYAGAVAARLFGTIEGCEVSNTTIVLLPNVVTTSFDNGDKAGALVGYLAANDVNKVNNNKVSGVNVKAYRDVAALVGRANTIDEMSGNVVENCEIVLDQMIAGAYAGYEADFFSTIGTLIGRLDDNTTANITNNTVTNVNLNTVNADGVEAKIENPKEVGLNK